MKKPDFRRYRFFKKPILFRLKNLCLATALVFCFTKVIAQKHILDSSMHHLRIGDQPEWSEFAGQAAEKELVIHFTSRPNTIEHTLYLRQYDVKQVWRIILNGHTLDSLIVDGNDMRTYFKISPGILRTGENSLSIEPATNIPDDIVVGEIVLEDRPVQDALSEAVVEIEVVDRKHNKLMPSRLTITDSKGTLQTIGNKTDNQLAVRPGFVYSANGKASLRMPAGKYTIYAGRGFEYGIDSFKLNIQPGQQLRNTLSLAKEVPTKGWVSCDTHIHTLTNSGHGDATDEERALTIAGEGIELPVITEHNFISDFLIVAKRMRVDTFFTTVPGDEVTTAVGHFN